eukprot:7546491-Pyramimonas_sp.AAC.1
MGVDRLSSHGPLRRPEGALQEVATLLGAREATQSRPRQVLLAIGAVRPKKIRGSRNVLLVPRLSRV